MCEISPFAVQDLVTWGISVFCVVLIVVLFYVSEVCCVFLHRRRSIRRMVKSGKYLAWPEVAAKLKSGEGMAVIVQNAVVSWSPRRLNPSDLTREFLETGSYEGSIGFLTKCPRHLLSMAAMQSEFPTAHVIDYRPPTSVSVDPS